MARLRLLRSLTLAIVAMLLAAPIDVVAQQTKALVGGTVVSPNSEAPLANATVLIKDSRIAAVGPSNEIEVPAGAQRIDVSGQYIAPGLVDGHVHFFQSGGLYTRPDVIDLRFRKPYTEEIADIKASLPETFRHYLRSGITSVVDVGGPMWNLDVRQKAHQVEKAPRVVAAGPLLSTWQPPELAVDDPPIIEVHDPARARRLVREQAEAGVDLIKIWYIVRRGETPEEHLPMVRAVIDEAHAADLRVAVHARQHETAHTAVEAGADILVHSVTDMPVKETFVQLLKENDVIYTPTLMVRERYGEVFAGQFTPTDMERRLADPQVLASLDDLSELPADSLPGRIQRLRERDMGEIEPSATAMQNLETLHEAGVTIAAGTDAGNIGTPHGPALFYELQLMREAGLSSRAVLRAATVGGARLMGRANDLGSIEAGKLADLVILDKNPLKEIKHTSTVRRLMKDGRMIQLSSDE